MIAGFGAVGSRLVAFASGLMLRGDRDNMLEERILRKFRDRSKRICKKFLTILRVV